MGSAQASRECRKTPTPEDRPVPYVGNQTDEETPLQYRCSDERKEPFFHGLCKAYELEAVIPRYYLHYQDGDGRLADHLGRDLADLDAAHTEALRIIRKLRQLWSDLPPEVRNDLAFEIADETGRTVLTVPFTEVEGWIH